MMRTLPRLLWPIACAALLAVPIPAAAADNGGMRLQMFEPAPGTTNYWGVQGSRPLEHLQFAGGLYFNYAGTPLRIAKDGEEITKILEKQMTVDLTAGIGLFDLLDISIAIPLVISQSSGDLSYIGRPGESINSFATGNLRVVPKVRFLDNREQGPGLSLALAASIPTGDVKDFVSDAGLTVEPRLVFDYRVAEHTSFGVNAGYLWRDTATFLNQDVGPMLTFGLGAEIGVLENVSVIAEIFGGNNMGGDFSGSRELPVEWLLGGRWYGPAGLVVNLGGGTGITDGYGNPAPRIMFGIGYASGATPKDPDGDGIVGKDDQCPDQAEDVDEFEDADGCPDPDNDKDGVPDVDDKCPDKAEDKDDFEDDDGCPDLDNDGDKIPDEDDKCPNKKEDKDKFEDDDGCPDDDNDKDGIKDKDDQCPNNAEDKDGYEDEDGCPDPVHDRDKDGIPDERDKCPDEPETINGIKDDDGCPDKGKSKVQLTGDEIKILDMVFFDTGKATIQKKSFNLLDQVASIILANQQILLIEVAGHTDDVGDDSDNEQLSQARAESVVKYLTGKGIAVRRFKAKGYGESAPKVDISEWTETPQLAKKNARQIKAARAENRRVEFKILKQGKVFIEVEEDAEDTDAAEEEKPKAKAKKPPVEDDEEEAAAEEEEAPKKAAPAAKAGKKKKKKK
ncbi:MAG: OmpA family protein [Myxococcota bacterium]|nr:OmpA family protein [Myxococcota bacterium]